MVPAGVPAADRRRVMAWRSGALLLGAALIAASVAWAEETDDLDRIPVPDPSVDVDDRPVASGWRIYAEQALTLPRFRDGLVVPPTRQRHPDWQERLSLDARRSWSLDPRFKATYSGRLNLLAEDGGRFRTGPISGTIFAKASSVGSRRLRTISISAASISAAVSPSASVRPTSSRRARWSTAPPTIRRCCARTGWGR